jgi:lipoate-protein ligase A
MQIERLIVLSSHITDIYNNQSMEAYLLNHCPRNSCILFLWQNDRTVVIGRNQNAWNECCVRELNSDNGKLARRLSGGGAVYHDLGNINFTFICNEDSKDISKQTEVIIRAVNSFGLDVKRTGRNDLEINGRKFSGHAYYDRETMSLHHGTIMIDVNEDALTKYLCVPKHKLVFKGITSVRSRVGNLSEISDRITVAAMKQAIITACSDIYGLCVERWSEKIDFDEFLRLKNMFSSKEWILGCQCNFTWHNDKHFDWGNIEFKFDVQKKIIKDCRVYSDAMDASFVASLPSVLIGKDFDSLILCEAVRQLDPKNFRMIDDICSLFSEQGF